MHELSIAEAIISAVVRERDDRNLTQISTVGVRVGALSGVLPDALRFSFETAVEGTSLAAASLSIDCVPARGQCRDCTQRFEVDECCFRCPSCGSDQIEVLSGWELDIAYLEVSEESDEESDID